MFVLFSTCGWVKILCFTVAKLLFDDDQVQITFNDAFVVAPNPPPPVVIVNTDDVKKDSADTFGDVRIGFTWSSGTVTFNNNDITTEEYDKFFSKKKKKFSLKGRKR